MIDLIPSVTYHKEWPFETCEFIGPSGYFWSTGRCLFHSNTIFGPSRRIAVVPRPALRRLLGSTQLLRRLSRETFYNVLPLSDGRVFFSFGSCVGWIQNNHVHFINGRERATKVLRGGCARMPDGSIVFGEYFSNHAREAVNVYRVRPGELNVEIVYRFPPGEIRHIHSINWDPYTERAFVATGDIGLECRIVAFDSDFKNFETIGSGTEAWRAISLEFSPDSIYFGTDAEYEQNYIYRYDRKSRDTHVLSKVNGPIFFSAALNSGWVFASVAEMCPSQCTPNAALYYVDAITNFVSPVIKFEKDCLPKKYFQFGMLKLPLLESPVNTLPVTGMAVRGVRATMALIRE